MTTSKCLATWCITMMASADLPIPPMPSTLTTRQRSSSIQRLTAAKRFLRSLTVAVFIVRQICLTRSTMSTGDQKRTLSANCISRSEPVAPAIPKLPAPEGSRLLAHMMNRMHGLETYRLDETLSSGLAVIPSRYAFQAPDRLESIVTESSGGSQMVWIGGTRYLREGDGSWQVLHGGPPPVVPSFIWDFFRPFIDARILGRTAVEGVPTRVVTFFGKSGVTPLWFRLWVDREGLVRRTRTWGDAVPTRRWAPTLGERRPRSPAGSGSAG